MDKCVSIEDFVIRTLTNNFVIENTAKGNAEEHIDQEV